MPYLPCEIIGEIGSHIELPQDFVNFRLGCERIQKVTEYAMAKRIEDSTIYPRLDSMLPLMTVLENPDIARSVHEITLLAESLTEHEYGYLWTWEDLQIWNEFEFTENDITLVGRINSLHRYSSHQDSAFIMSGDYRNLLTEMLELLPNLTTIKVRKLNPGEHIPGWGGDRLCKQLSFHHDTLDTRKIFYDDWQYDTVHGRVTQYRDEYGEIICEPSTGPQATFIDDLRAAMYDSDTDAKVKFLS